MRVFVLLLLALPGALMAQGKSAILDVFGKIGIDRQGAVYEYKIGTSLTPEVKALVERSVKQWKFEPVLRDGHAVDVESHMYLTVAALPAETGYRLRIDSVRFGDIKDAVTKKVPQYPYFAWKANAVASVLVAARVDRQGRVLDAIAVHTAMPNYQITEKFRDRLVRLFEDESLKAIKQWRYSPSDAGALDVATVFTKFLYQNEKISHFSEGWRAPNKPIPWLPVGKQQYDVTGLKEGESLALDSRIKLNTKVVGTTL